MSACVYVYIPPILTCYTHMPNKPAVACELLVFVGTHHTPQSHTFLYMLMSLIAAVHVGRCTSDCAGCRSCGRAGEYVCVQVMLCVVNSANWFHSFGILHHVSYTYKHMKGMSKLAQPVAGVFEDIYSRKTLAVEDKDYTQIVAATDNSAEAL